MMSSNMILLVSLAAYLATLGNAQNTPTSCPTDCSDETLRVCGRGLYPYGTRLFINRCHFMRAQCEEPHRMWDIVSHSNCPEWHYHSAGRWEDPPAQPRYPTSHPGNPTGRPGYPTTQPRYPTTQPGPPPEPKPRENKPAPELIGYCPSIACSKEPKQICAKAINPEELRVFNTHCEFWNEQCRMGQHKRNWKKVEDSMCPEIQTSKPTPLDSNCPTACATNIEPVCASNGRSHARLFINECWVRAEECAEQLPWKRLDTVRACSDHEKYNRKPSTPQPQPSTPQPQPSNPQPQPAMPMPQPVADTRPRGSECNRQACSTQPRQPICAETRERRRMTFENPCFVQAYECENRLQYSLQRLPLNECPDAGKYSEQRNVGGPQDPTRHQRNNQCSRSCGDKVEPICATANGVHQIFNSRCALDIEKCEAPGRRWTELPMHRCSKSTHEYAQMSSCPPNCPTNDNVRVCGKSQQEMRTFANSCELYKAQCIQPSQGWKDYHPGPCTEDELRQGSLPTPSQPTEERWGMPAYGGMSSHQHYGQAYQYQHVSQPSQDPIRQYGQ